MVPRVVVIGLFVLLAGLLCVQTYRLEMLRRNLPEAGGGVATGVVQARVDFGDAGDGGDAAGGTAGGGDPADGGAGGDEGTEPVEAEGLDAYLEALDGRIRERMPAGAGAGETAGDEVVGGTGEEGTPASRRAERKAAVAEAERQAAKLAQRARSAIENGQYEDAVSLLEEALAADPSSRDAYRELAGLYQKMGYSDDALATYAEWSRNRPNDATPCYQQARLLSSLGRDGEALAQLQRFEQLSEGELSALPMAASLYRTLKMPAEEGVALSEWASAVPESPDARRALAQYYNRVGDKPGALSEYQAVAALVPANANAHRDLAQAYQRLRQYPEAQQELVTALSLRPNDMQTRLQLGQVQRQLGDAGGAVATYEGVMADAPGTVEARQAQRAINQVNRQLQRATKQ